MLRILNDELGFDIKERELMRVRAKNRWLLRVPNGMKAPSTVPSRRGHVDEEDALQQLAQAMYPEISHDMGTQPVLRPQKTTSGLRAPSPELSPEVIAKRRERLEKLQAESAERWVSRKRRRRTRGWAGLPADPPGPPRFPSETTIDESKQFLNLDTQMYKRLRDHFQTICEEAGFIKKTIAGPERWQAAKNRLIQESLHLQAVFWADNTQTEAKQLALDVVCTDVTKRMRTLERRMTIAEAKNALGINPEESRQVRHAFYQTLKDDHFTSKLEAGDEHWKELKAQWISEYPLLQQILAPGAADPEHETKVKAMEVLCRDVMKRLRDDQTKRDPSRKKSLNNNNNNRDTNGNRSDGISNGISTLASQALASAPSLLPHQSTSLRNDYSDLQIDPSLLFAANNDPSIAGVQHRYSQPFPQQTAPGTSSYQHDPSLPGAPHSPSLAIPIYFRVHPLSPFQPSTKLWLATLTSTSVFELRQLAQGKHNGAVEMVKIEGVVKDEGGGRGHEVAFKIDEDDELRAYLSHVEGGKATFVVMLREVYTPG